MQNMDAEFIRTKSILQQVFVTWKLDLLA